MSDGRFLVDGRDVSAAEFVRASVRVEDLRVLDHGGGDPTFTLVVGPVHSSALTLEDLVEQKRFRVQLARLVRQWFSHRKPGEWHEIAAGLLAMAEPAPLMSEEDGRVLAMLRGFLEAEGDRLLDPEVVEDRRTMLTDKIGVFRDEHDSVYVRLRAFHAFAAERYEDLESVIATGRRLSRLGFVRPRNHEGKVTLRDTGGLPLEGRFLVSPTSFVAVMKGRA